MKRAILSLLLLFPLVAIARYYPSAEVQKSRDDFASDRFGIFLHWGLYSTFAQGEWFMQNEDIDRNEYAKAAQAFYPHNFNARAWVKAIKAAGAKYITFTSRHHEGFSMWATRQSDYNIMNTPYGKDIVKQLAEACQKEGIALHLYYSHIDWTREDYPMGRTGLKTGKNPKKADWKSYYSFMNAQLRELLTNYGPIRCIWFDGWWDHDSDPAPFNWQLEEQYALIHSLQPGCLVANNHHQPPFEGEDIQIFERDVPGENSAEWNTSTISRLPLETCQTMNGMWGYKVKDQNYKTAEELIRLLVRTSGKGANLLLNIGPQPDGSLPHAALARLQDMGKWLGRYGQTIYGTQAGPVQSGTDYATTRKGKTLWLHVLNADLDKVQFSLAGEKVAKVTAFGSKKTLKGWKQDGDQFQFRFATDRSLPDNIYEITLR